MNVLSLFTGAGGLDLGLEAAGFEIEGCVERDADARETLNANTAWPLASHRDIEKVAPRDILSEFGMRQGDVTLLAGGPPCQPFSKSGQWVTGAASHMADPRAATLRKYFEMLDASLPRMMLLENVKGLVAKPRQGSPQERAQEVFASALEDVNTRHGTSYVPRIVHLDAVDFGVPQRRERVFVIATRDGDDFVAPTPTHGPRAAAGSPRASRCWDVLGDLNSDAASEPLRPTGMWADLLPTIPEGHNYLHHTARGEGKPLFGWRRKYWSFLLKLAKAKPSWTIQAQPGPATGPFHWTNRKLSAREMARLQSFPDRIAFAGSYQSVRRQLGNAVPPAVGEVLGLELRKQILGDCSRAHVTSLHPQRDDCPEPERPAPVPHKYLGLCGVHADHPGPGRGPGAMLRDEAEAAA